MPKHPESSHNIFEPKTRVILTQDQAKGISVGQGVNISLSGKVSGISEDFEDKSKFNLEIKGTKVSGIKGNSADKAAKEMSRKR